MQGGQTTATANKGSLINSGINGAQQTTAGGATANASGGKSPSTPSTTAINNVPVIVLPSSSLVIGGEVVTVPAAGSIMTVVANGQTFTVENSQIVAASTTIPLEVVAGPTQVTAGGLVFAVGSTNAVVSGKTYAIGKGAAQETEVIGSKTVIFGSGGVVVPGQTIAPEKITAAPSSFSVITAGGLTLSLDATEVVLGSKTYRIGQGATQTVITVSGKTLTLGTQGVAMGSSTIPPATITAAPSLSAVTADGLSFSVDATEVFVGSHSFRIGSGAPTETTVINGKTLTIGPSGVALGSTTVTPPTAISSAVSSTGLQAAGASLTKYNVVGMSTACILATFIGLFIV